MVRDVLVDLAFVGVEERGKARGFDLNADDLCEVNADGQIASLLLGSTKQVPPVALAMLEAVTMLVAPDTSIGVQEARTLAKLQSVEHLLIAIDPNATDEVLAQIAQMHTLTSLGIVNTEAAIDVEPLGSLPALKSLLLATKTRQNTLHNLARFPALRSLALNLSGATDTEALADLSQVEKLLLTGAEELDLSFLRQMSRLISLLAEDAELTPILPDLVNLQTLAIRFAHPSLELLVPLAQLRSLTLTKAALQDFSHLGSLKNLEQLVLAHGSIGDLSTLPPHQSLRFLNLSSNPIVLPQRDFELPGLKHLEWEAHHQSRLPHASFLAGCHELETLNLSGHAFEDAEFVRSLGNLRSLNLAGNYLTNLEVLEDLPNLAVVDVSRNRLTRVSPLASNASLSSLNVAANLLEDVQALGTLTRLEDMNIDGTGTSDLSFVKRLKQLYRLSAADNRLRHAEALLELPHLAVADLSNNQIASVSRDLCEHRSLVSLRLKDNPIEGLDAEHYSADDGRETLKSLRDYYRGLSRGSVRHDQVKLVLVGNGRVGKTSVVNRLIDGTFDGTQPSTHGIQLRQWALPDVLQDKLDGVPLKVNVWDFGGQDIYHATHRLFMRTRALFLLVWDRQTEEQRYSLDESGERYENFRLPYWIDYIKALSSSPVIIVQNKVDSLKDKQSGYGAELRDTYPPPQGILDFAHVSARRDQQNGMSALADTVVLALDDIESIGQKLPAQWVDVRDRLQSMERRYLDFPEFVELCASVGLGGTEPESVASFFHKAGTLFYQKREFGDRIILDQKWAIEAVYALFDRRRSAYTDLKLAAREGLTLDLLKRKVWRHFSEDEHNLLLEFMKACELCFELTKGIYYVPQLLPDEKLPRVRLRWKHTTDHCIQITYPFLHRAIIERFLVRTGALGADEQPEIWKNGITILDSTGGTEAMVEAFPTENRVVLQARGDAPVELLQMIRHEFDDLEPAFGATTTVSVDGGRNFVELLKLDQYAAAKAQFVESTAKTLVEVAPLEVFLGTATRRLTKSRGRLTPSGPGTAEPSDEIFVSYAWGDRRETGDSREAIVDRLYDTLVSRGHKVVRDKKDNGYGKRISEFMRRLGEGKLVVVVVSDKYLKSPYCMYELLEIYEHGGLVEGRMFPIVLSDAKMYSLADRLEYVLHWKREKKKIEDLINELGLDAFSAEGTYREYDQYYRRIFQNVDQLTALLRDINALTPQLLEDNNFEVLVTAITARVAATGGAAGV